MGSGTIILVGLLVGGYFLVKHFGAFSFFTTLLNPAKSRFTCQEEESSGTAVFDITPARASWAIILFCIAIFFVGLIFPPVWLFIPVFGYFLLIGVRYRKPVRCRVSDQRLSAGERSWSLSEIASLQIRKGSRRGEEEVGTIVTTDPVTGMTTGSKSTSALLGKALGGRMAERSYMLTLRTRQSSEEEKIAGGLTLECAKALLQDLNERIRQDKRLAAKPAAEPQAVMPPT